MPETITIAVDALGGDFGPSVVLPGVEAALAEQPDICVLLCGPEDVVVPFAQCHERCEAVPCTQEIEMGEHPANAVRRKKDSSIVVGCRLVKEGKAQGFFSAGSTGACLAAGTLVAGRIKGVSRPALGTVLPSPVKPVVMCDVGANADCKPEYLLQFAKMATIYTRQILGVENPSVGLLNIGSEETKGSQFAQETHRLLAEQLPNFKGNCEGCDVLTGEFDIVVTDGFTGNVCLKTIEGTAKMLFGELKGVFKRNALTGLAALAVKGGLSQLKQSVSADTYGGAPLLGVKGACLVGHGSSNETAIKNGVLMAAKIVRTGVSELIAESIGSEAKKPAE
ncbi:MAG: phosphate acyltransferase PlsX [Coriobacteriaceae bacterium]|nr:phosphate acyltransferase PlsX [Coriobacteriaceae bacterium]MDY3799423.1 phosphate acyltransferase PlsX [Eggerthellaceae bacterium]MDD6636179.1 phosphate acyltransferase PlsX [Coriobacteriaceae bacterium]MDD7431161.1 phosphate acyltransferase PlsX [Coriobacteriaceae bacterium]MDO4499501.1 phosphate acyltransferase PlsX [Coriobacteriaceae bacterium]